MQVTPAEQPASGSRAQSAIQNVARKLQPEIDVSLVSDEWKALQSDSDLDNIDKEQRIEHYWNDVFALKSVANTNRYTILPCVMKSGLVLAQMNAESERSLSINARVVTKERCALRDTTIIWSACCQGCSSLLRSSRNPT